jgi:hypothetical protein
VPWGESVPSFLAGVRRNPAATAQDLRVQRLAASLPVDDADGRYGRAIECVRGRASHELTRFDGNVSRVAALVPGPARDRKPISATSLQEWAINPFEYFVGKVLGAEIPEPPEERFELSALDRGSLMHLILERWLLERLQSGDVPKPDQPWTDEQTARLTAIAGDAFREYEDQGLTGRAVFWGRDQLRIRRDLEEFVAKDDGWRRDALTTPCAAELDFGLLRSARPAVEMPLADGRVVLLRGSADRVDTAVDGTIHVIDYKTGKANGTKDISEIDPDQRGTKLQLPVYALAARAALGRSDAPVSASYWFITVKEGFRRVPLQLTPAVHERIDHVISEIVDGVEAGLFPCRPGEDGFFRSRTHTDPDALGTRDLARAWARKRSDAALARYCELAGEEIAP